MIFDAKNATVEELIERYNISLQTEFQNGKLVLTGKIYTPCGQKVEADNATGVLKERKAAIYAYLLDLHDAKIKAAEERQAKIDAIEGLKELRAARADIASWNEEFEKSFDNVGGLGVRPRPVYDMKALEEKYPRASAYLKADSWSDASNFEKASAGKKALERIINGEDHALVLLDMQEEWSKACESHLWD